MTEKKVFRQITARTTPPTRLSATSPVRTPSTSSSASVSLGRSPPSTGPPRVKSSSCLSAGETFIYKLQVVIYKLKITSCNLKAIESYPQMKHPYTFNQFITIIPSHQISGVFI